MNPVLVFAPRIGPAGSMLSVRQWLLPDGGSISEGAPLVRLETAKVQQTVRAPTSGILKQYVADGRLCAPGACIGTITPA